MGYPVVHFEINSARAVELAAFYADAFGWRVEADGPGDAQIHTDGECPGSGDPGIDGGIGTSEVGDDFVTIYVQVPDVTEALAKAVELGGTINLPATEAGRVLLGVLRDPAGNRIGLVRAEPLQADTR